MKEVHAILIRRKWNDFAFFHIPLSKSIARRTWAYSIKGIQYEDQTKEIPSKTIIGNMAQGKKVTSFKVRQSLGYKASPAGLPPKVYHVHSLEIQTI